MQQQQQHLRQSSSLSEFPISASREQIVPPMPGTQIGMPAWVTPVSSSSISNNNRDGSINNNTGATTSSFIPQPHLEFQNKKAAVFWDFENCPPPSGMPGYVVVENIRNVIHHFGHVVLFKAYLEINDGSSSSNNNNSNTTHSSGSTKKALRSELQSSGVSLTDCPHNGRKDAADKMLMVDMLAFAIDNEPPATIVLISGDKDFVYALSTLRNRRYNIVLIVPSRGAPIILRSQANTILEWRYDVLNQDVWNMQQDQVMKQVSIQPSAASNSSNGSSSSSSGQSSLISTSTGVSPNNNNYNGSVLSDSNDDTDTASVTTSPQLKRARSPLSKELKVSVSPPKPTQQPSYASKVAELSINSTSIYHPLATEDSDAADYVGYCFSPKAPGFFDLLVEILEKLRSAGETMPKRSKIGNDLVARNPLLYHRAGCSSFKEYVELAVKEGIVNIGGEKGNAWISLHENYRDKLY